MIFRRRFFGVRFAIVAAFAGALALALTPLAGGASRYTDPAGDSGNGPDLTDIRVSNNAAGRLTFRITVANRTAGLAFREAVTMPLDTDLNPATGGNGYDFRVSFAPREYAVARWNGARFEVFDPPSDAATNAGGVITFAIDRGDFGNTSGFRFGVGALDTAQRVADTAPNSGVFTYTLQRFCVVPRVRGKTLTAASAAVRKAGCRVGKIRRRASRLRRNRVLAQSPAAGREVARGSRVNLVVSRGRR